MKTRILLSFFLFLLVNSPLSGCDKHNAKGYLTVADCEPYCEKLVACSGDSLRMMAGRRQIASETLESGMKLQSKRACMSTCSTQIHPQNMFKYPQWFKFYQYFLRGQMECLTQPDCAKLTACRQAQLVRAIAEFPMDETDARRCDETCTRIHQCADILVPRVFLTEFSQAPLDKQAELIRQHGDRDRCLHSCRFASIKNRLDKRKLTSTVDDNWEDLQPFMQCLAHTDCAQFTQCVTSQSTGASF